MPFDALDDFTNAVKLCAKELNLIELSNDSPLLTLKR
jgi:hypothetical protein